MAAAPLTSGVATEVPLCVAKEVGLVNDALLTSCPGANMSTHLPKFVPRPSLLYKSLSP